MENEKLLKILPYGAAVVLLAGYLLFFYFRLSDRDLSIANLEMQKNRLAVKLKKLEHSSVEDEELTENMFFNEQKFFEEYIRELFSKNQARISQYRIQIEKKDRGVISVLFDVPILNFFTLLHELEEGEKLIIINNVNVRKMAAPYVQVQIRLEGYYK